MKYQEDFVLDKKYLNLIDKCIYNTKTDKFGMITAIEIDGSGIFLKTYYDNMDSDCVAFFGDFEKGKLKFIVIKGLDLPKGIQKDFERETKEDIKLFFGEKFTEDMIMYVEEEKRKAKNEENEQKEIKNIRGKLMNLSKLSAEIFYDNYTALELYKNYTKGNLAETQLLYGICNHLCEEIKYFKDRNLELSMKGFLEEQARFLIDYTQSRLEKQGKTIKEEDKENMFKVMDLLIGIENKAED